jgi:hypothetical protein
MTGSGAARWSMALVATVLAVGSAACGNTDDPPISGADVNADTGKVFATLMQRPDIDQAAEQYQRMDADLRQALSQAVPALAAWRQGSEGSQASCGSDYPGIGFDGQTRSLPSNVVSGTLSDADYEKALETIGSFAQQYGFTVQPQRLHDSPGSHDAVFHNVHDDGEISFGTAQNTSLRVKLGCHLTTEAKKRGAPTATANH